MRLRLLSYNVHKCAGTDGRTDVGRIADVIAHYAADVVCLQEVMWFEPWRDRRSQCEELFERLPHAHAAVALNARRRFGMYGNVTLSLLPIVEQDNLDLSLPLKRSRSALRTRLDAGGQSLDVHNIHLGLARFERRLQGEWLATSIDEEPRPADAVIVLGDTNDWRDVLFGDAFAPAGFGTHVPRRSARSHGTFPSWYPVAHLDRAFVRGGVHLLRVFPSRLALARTASDHLPLVIDVELPGSPPTGASLASGNR